MLSSIFLTLCCDFQGCNLNIGVELTTVFALSLVQMSAAAQPASD